MTQTLRALAISTLLFLLAGCSLYDCGNDIYQRLDNRYKQYKILKFSRSCGATTGPSTQISVLPFDKELSNEDGGNIFVCNAYINDTSVKVQWTNDTSILITYKKDLEIFKNDSTFNDVKVKYQIE